MSAHQVIEELVVRSTVITCVDGLSSFFVSCTSIQNCCLDMCFCTDYALDWWRNINLAQGNGCVFLPTTSISVVRKVQDSILLSQGPWWMHVFFGDPARKGHDGSHKGIHVVRFIMWFVSCFWRSLGRCMLFLSIFSTRETKGAIMKALYSSRASPGIKTNQIKINKNRSWKP